MKISPADTHFSRCVRERADWTCERCGSKHDRGSMGLHCSHIFSRRHRTIRWCGDNAQALCFSCHHWFGGNPADSGVWVTDLLGDGHIAILREKMNTKLKISKQEEKEIAKYYKKEYDDMMEKRADGKVGRLEFISYQ